MSRSDSDTHVPRWPFVATTAASEWPFHLQRLHRQNSRGAERMTALCSALPPPPHMRAATVSRETIRS